MIKDNYSHWQFTILGEHRNEVLSADDSEMMEIWINDVTSYCYSCWSMSMTDQYLWIWHNPVIRNCLFTEETDSRWLMFWMNKKNVKIL